MVSTTFQLLLLALASQLSHAIPFPESPEANDVLPPTVKRAAGTQTMNVTATANSGRSEYLTQIQINGQNYNVLLDTGSTKLWVKGSGTGPSFNTSYGSGWAAGNVVTGNVTVGGITIVDQTYGLASSTMGEDGLDGIIGLRDAPTTYDSTSKTWMANIMPLLKQQRFGVNMVPNTLSGPGVSSFAFGYDDASHESTTPTYFPVVNWPAWYLSVTSFGVAAGSDAAAVCDIDTGTTYTYIPQSAAMAYWQQVAGATTTNNLTWSFPCTSTLPDFTPSINGTRVVIPGSYGTGPNYGRASTTCFSHLNGATSGCILGQNFLYGQYAVYDVQNKQIGLSPRK